MEEKTTFLKSNIKEDVRRRQEKITICKPEEKHDAKDELSSEIMGPDGTLNCTDTRLDLGKDCLRVGWTLDKEDLLCFSLMQSKAQAEEYRATDSFLLNYRKPFKRKKSYFERHLSSTLFESLINQIRDNIEDKGLFPHDVFPDGNCLFAAIVDQLRIQGDFSFTSCTLRHAAVQYLRRNPVTDDGTSLSMFLSDGETWESYLVHMSEDGAWGDHIILGALANVIGKEIIIYGGATGERETILRPRSQTGRREFFVSEHWTSDEYSVVYLGHVSDSHYISLRPKNWPQNLFNGLQKRRLTREKALRDNMLILFPVQQMNIIVRYMFKNGFIQSYTAPDADILKSICSEDTECRSEAFGSLTCKMVPFNSLVTVAKNEVRKDCKTQEVVLTVFQTPKDTDIVTSMSNSKSVDLLSVRTEQMTLGHLKLSPCEPRLWRWQTTSSNKGCTFIKTNDTCHHISTGIFPSKILQEKIDMQFALAFHCTWPDDAKKWTNRPRKFGFPDEQTVKSIERKGCHVIPLIPSKRMLYIYDDPVHFMTSRDDHIWCYSFAAAEKELSRNFSSEQEQVFLLFQAFVEIALKDILVFPSIIKSVFYYGCENIAVSCWRSDPVGCIFLLLKKLSLCFKHRHVPHYFMSEKNLIKHVPKKIIYECYEKLECCRIQPFVPIYILLERYTFLLSKKCICVEEIIENISYNVLCDTSRSSSWHNAFQVNSMFCKDLVYDRNYPFACIVIQDMIVEKGKSLHEDGGVEMAVDVLGEIVIELSWCFALYVDIQHKTKLTTALCKGHSCIALSEIFGPHCSGDLPDTTVPERFSIFNGDLKFALDASEVLSHVDTITYIKCLKYYLKQYGNLAGDSLILSCFEAGMAKWNASMYITNLTLLHKLYVKLFNACIKCLRVEEYREMMPTFISIAESLGTEVPIRNIRIMKSALDESEKLQIF